MPVTWPANAADTQDLGTLAKIEYAEPLVVTVGATRPEMKAWSNDNNDC